MTVAGWIAIGGQIGVALGTGALALFTWRLARSTRQDVEAQWRPLLVPYRVHITVSDVASNAWADISTDAMTGEIYFGFAMENVGRGAALGVSAAEQIWRKDGSNVIVPCDGPRSPVIAVGAATEFFTSKASPDDDRKSVVVEYKDLADHIYRAEVTYENDGSYWEVIRSVASGPHSRSIL